MKPIVAPIRSEEVSENVANLHRAMKYLGIGDFTNSNFEHEVSTYEAGKYTSVYIQEFQKNNGIQPTDGILIDQPTADLLNRYLKEKGLLDQEEPIEKYWLVKGKITLPNGKPGVKLTVQLYEQDFRSASSYDSTNTDKEGNYEIKYLPSNYAEEPEHYSPDLFILVTGGGALYWDESPIYYNVSPIAIIDLKIQKEPVFVTTEFERLEKVLKPIIKTLPPQELKASENDKQDDFGFLSNETGFDRKLIEFWATAYQYQFEVVKQDLFKNEELKLEQAFYAWQRVPDRKASYDAILSQSIETLLAQLKTAGEKMYVQPYNNSIEKVWVDALETEQYRIVFHAPQNALPSYAVLLPLVSTDQAFQQTFFATVQDHNGLLDENFWSKVAEALPNQEKLLEKTKLLLDATPLMDGQTSLGDYLVNKTNYSELNTLVGYSVEQWESLLTTLSAQSNRLTIPDFIQGTNEREKIKQYAIVIDDRMRQTYPAGYFHHDLLRHEDTPFKNQWQTFLKNNPRFQFGTPALSLMLRTDKAPFKFEGIEQKSAFAQELVFTNRLFTIAPNYGHVATLRQKGFTSAFDIAQYDPKVFTDLIIKEISAQEAQQYHGAATRKANVVSNLFVGLQTDNGIRTTVFGSQKSNKPNIVLFNGPGRSEIDNEVNEAVSATLANLFGSIEQAECEECMSVLSPAAYFVDTLNRLRVDAAATFNELIGRRADLGLIDLTCANTNTPLPYIDLVIEILERFIAHRDALHVENDHFPQTTLLSETLAVMPETPAIESVYKKLLDAESHYPFSLPYNLHWEELRLYLTHLGIRREEVMVLFDVAPFSIAAEYFGISPEEAAIITKTETESLYSFYGFANERVKKEELAGVEPAPNFESEPSWDEALTGFVNVFLYKTGISYRDLLTLLSTRFVQGKNALDPEKPHIVSRAGEEATTSKLDKLRITQLTPTHNLQRIYRFIRLWRRLGWSMYDLDRMLMALSKDDIDADALVQLHRADKIRQRLNLSVEEAATVINSLDDFRDYRDFFAEGQPLIRTLFQRTFGNCVVGPQSSQTVKDMAKDNAYIASVCQLSVGEVDRLQEAFSWGENIQKLSQIYGIGLLVRAMGISVAELLILKKLISRKPTLGSSEEDTLKLDFLRLDTAELLLDAIESIKQARLSIPEVEFIFSNNELDINLLFKILIKETRLQRQVFEWLKNDENKQDNKSKLDAFMGLAKQIIVPIISTFLQADQTLITELSYIDYSDLVNRLLALPSVESEVDDETKMLVQVGLLNIKKAVLLLNRGNVDVALAKLIIEKQYISFTILLKAPSIRIPDPELWKAFEEWGSFVSVYSEFLKTESKRSEFLALFEKSGFQYGDFRKDALSKRLGISPITSVRPDEQGAKDFLMQLATLSDPKNSAEKVRSLAKAKYTKPQWLKIAKPLQDMLREKQRDVLTDYILANYASLGFANRNELYEYLLIDVEMSACMKTSRLKLAISSVQLFIERVLMGLERVGFKPDGSLLTISSSTPLASQWNKWRKWYRIWEANRKVFLYPENWIEPELRDNKSPFFEEFENQLAQNAVTNENAERAFRDYFAKFETVARLEIIAQYHEKENPAGEGTLHVFGRTYSEPQQYFYRRLIYKEWTAWERVDLDIEGDAMTPVVWNGKLYLFWLNFMKKSEEANGDMTIKSSKEGEPTSISSEKPNLYYEIRLVWSEYESNKWKAKKISKVSFNSGYIGASSYENVGLVASNKDSQLLIKVVNNFSNSSVGEATIINDSDYAKLIHRVASSADVRPQLPFIISTEKDKILNNLVTGKIYIDYLKSNNSFSSGSVCFEAVDPIFTLPKHKFFQDIDITLYLENNSVTQQYSSRDSLNPNNLLTRNRDIISTAMQQKTSLFFHSQAKIFRKSLKYGIDSFYNGYLGIHSKNQWAKSNIFSNYEYIRNLIYNRERIDSVDFSFSSSYSLYNWELFFHIPITIACRLSENQQFAEARYWLHYIFDPTSGEPGGKERFWQFRPFHEEAGKDSISLEELIRDGEIQIEKWEANDFQPHVIARMRILSYMKFTVMRYIDNLINWGDQLFQRDTIESINEATLLYVLASKILGKRPEIVPRRAIPVTQRFSTDSAEQWGAFQASDLEDAVVAGALSNVRLNAFSNATVPIREFIFPNGSPSSNGLGTMDYFCIPKNPKLLGYWDKVGDRLFKIRNCMNIQGMVRQLPLFEPPIDPALLVRAANLGLNVDAILRDTSTANLPHYRFQVMLQKALELANEVKSLGAQLLSAFEKRDAEELALIRSTQERKLLKMVHDVKQKQVEESSNLYGSIGFQLDNIKQRIQYYTQLLNPTDGDEHHLNAHEKLQLSKLEDQKDRIEQVKTLEQLASGLAYIPDFKLGGPTTVGTTYGGSSLVNAMKGIAAFQAAEGQLFNIDASRSAILGSYQRRSQEWQHQLDSAKKEQDQVVKQQTAAEIRYQIAQKDLGNHELQMSHSEDIDQFMREKFSNQKLYHWMKNQLSTLYFQSYRLAYDMATKAEKCFEFEVAEDEAGSKHYINYTGWNSLNEALLVGEKLTFELRRMEIAFLEQNKRDFEITKHISLSHYKLVKTSENDGKKIEFDTDSSNEKLKFITFKFVKDLFDADFSNHYFRRIKSVSISIPCVAGPYTSISATLRQQKSHVILRSGDELEYTSAISAIATSSAQNDSGMFELNFRDERYLPFEGSGAISEWRLEFSGDLSILNSITDIIIHLKYTARG